MSEETVNQEMTENGDAENQSADGSQRTFSQEEVNKLVGNARIKERGKYADYDDLKAKAAKFDEIEEASKTELEKAKETIKNLEAERDKLNKEAEIAGWKTQVSSETGIPAELLRGSTLDEIQDHAEKMKSYMGSVSKYPESKESGKQNTDSDKEAELDARLRKAAGLKPKE